MGSCEIRRRLGVRRLGVRRPGVRVQLAGRGRRPEQSPADYTAPALQLERLLWRRQFRWRIPERRRHGWERRIVSTDPSGVLGGMQFGYNYLFSPNWLIGLEVEFDWTSGQGTATFANATTVGTFTSNHNWYDIVAGRLGYTMGPWFYYVKGGVA